MYLTVDLTQDRIIDCNETTLQLLGYSESELLDQPVAAIFADSHATEWRQRLHAEFQQRGSLCRMSGPPDVQAGWMSGCQRQRHRHPDAAGPRSQRAPGLPRHHRAPAR